MAPSMARDASKFESNGGFFAHDDALATGAAYYEFDVPRHMYGSKAPAGENGERIVGVGGCLTRLIAYHGGWLRCSVDDSSWRTRNNSGPSHFPPSPATKSALSSYFPL